MRDSGPKGRFSFAVIGLALAVVVSGPVAAQQTGMQSLEQLMESPAGSGVVRLVEHLNSEAETSNDQLSQFFSAGLIERVGVERLQAVLEDIRTNDGQWEIYDADRPEVFRYELKAKGTRHGKWLDIVFRIDPEPPHRIDGIDGVDFSREGPRNETPLIPVAATDPTDDAPDGD